MILYILFMSAGKEKNTYRSLVDTKKPKKQRKEGSIFDDVFKTMCEKMPKLLIPLINEAFGTSYDEKEEIIPLRSEKHLGRHPIITDSLIKISGQIYHIECQSNDSGNMIIRMFEYDAGIAIEHRDSSLPHEIRFPISCVIYIRNTHESKSPSELKIVFPDGQEVIYRPKILNIQEYSKDDIFRKKLLMFLPYYILRYEHKIQKECCTIELNELLNDYQSIIEDLDKALPDDMSDYYSQLIDMISRINDYVTSDKNNVRKGLGDIMGGKVLVTRTDRIIARSEAKGKAEGKAEGNMECYVSLINDGDITLARAAEKMKMTIAVFKKKAEEYGLTITAN